MKVLFIIAFRDFQDWEFLKTKEILENSKIECDVASTQKGLAKGSFGAEFKVSLIMDELVDKVKDYDAIIFIGGAGTPSIRTNKYSIKLAEEFNKQNKLICAICWAPTILAKAGFLKNKSATVWFGPDIEYNKTTKEVLEQYGANYLKEFIVKDKNIITAEGPTHTEKFANEIVKYLLK